MINIKMQPAEVQKLSPKITVLGVGGAGGNAVNNMISSGLEGCEFVVCNTDAQALNNSLCQNRVQLGVHVTGGLGAGSKPDIGKAAAEENLEDVLQYLEGANMAFVTAGMGGGTGTGAAPIIAKACRERGVLTVGVITKPFHFEGSHRMRSAEAGIEEMQQYVDTLIVIPNQNLFRVANEKTTFAEAFRMADSVLQSGVRGVTDLMVRPGLVNLDFADIRTAMMEMGKAMMGTGEASGDKRAVEAAEAAINNPLLDDVSMKGARGVIINVTGGYDMTLFEADEACNRIRDEVDPNANIIFGATFDENLEGVMRVSIVATGIEREADLKRRPSGSFGAKGKLERAQPNTDVQPQQQSMATTPTPARHMPYMPAAAQNIRGITAPAPLAAPAVAAEASVMAAASDPEADLFEQHEFAELGAQNAAMRGARYKDSFIPPKPVTAEGAMMADIGTNSYHGRLTGEQQQSSPGLKLNPPKLPQPQQQPQQRTPSLFERITGSVQQWSSGMREEEEYPRERMSPSPQMSSGMMAPPRPAQGSLNISAPAGKPRSQADEELDIPAFLRRQAN